MTGITDLDTLVESANATYLLQTDRPDLGNLGSHLAKLEEAGYVDVVKGYTGKQPQTTISLTAQGGSALIGYRENLLAALAPVAE